MIMHASIITDKSVTVTFLDTGDTFSYSATEPQYTAVKDALQSGMSSDDLRVLTDKKTSAIAATAAYGDFTVTEAGITYKGRMLNNGLTRRIIAVFVENGDAAPLVNFLGRLLKNQRRTAVERLYDFMDANNLPVTADGCFIAYKIVKGNYHDIYTGKMDNSPGNIVEVEPNEVDENIDNTCSHGLHVCSREYLPHYGSGMSGNDKIVIVKVDPAHVVAIPRDYNNAKMRVYRYTVIGELKDKFATDLIESRALATAAGYGDSGSVAWHSNFSDAEDDFDGVEDDYVFGEDDFWSYN